MEKEKEKEEKDFIEVEKPVLQKGKEPIFGTGKTQDVVVNVASIIQNQHETKSEGHRNHTEIDGATQPENNFQEEEESEEVSEGLEIHSSVTTTTTTHHAHARFDVSGGCFQFMKILAMMYSWYLFFSISLKMILPVLLGIFLISAETSANGIPDGLVNIGLFILFIFVVNAVLQKRIYGCVWDAMNDFKWVPGKNLLQIIEFIFV